MTLTPWFPGDTCPYRVGVCINASADRDGI